MNSTSPTAATITPAPMATELRPGLPTPYRYAPTSPVTPAPTEPASRIQDGTTAPRNAGPYTSGSNAEAASASGTAASTLSPAAAGRMARVRARASSGRRSEEHTSELQSQSNLVCRLLLEKKKYE